MTLGAPEDFRWLALRRVKAGGVARSGDGWLQYGSQLGLVLAEFLGVLPEEGLVEVGDPSPLDGLSRVSLTDAGQARYAALGELRRPHLPVPPAEHGTPTRDGAW